MKRALSIELNDELNAISEKKFAEGQARYNVSVISQRQAEGCVSIDPDEPATIDCHTPDGGLTRAVRINGIMTIVRTMRCCRCARRLYKTERLCCWNVACSRCGAIVTVPSYISRDLPPCCAEKRQQFRRRLEIE